MPTMGWGELAGMIAIIVVLIGILVAYLWRF